LEGCGEMAEGVLAAARRKVVVPEPDRNGTPVSEKKTLSPAPREQQQQQQQT